MELKKFARKTIPDDPPLDKLRRFRPGVVSFAGSGDNSRDTQLFISYGAAKSLGTQPWETPLGEVIDGMENIKRLTSEYKEQPKQWKIHGGSQYIEENFPNLDKFNTCSVLRTELKAAGEEEETKKEKLEQEEKKIASKKPLTVAAESAPIESKNTIEGKLDKFHASPASSRLGSTLALHNGQYGSLVLVAAALLVSGYFVRKRLSGSGRAKII